ncbi:MULTISPECIES: hypothetical protein [Mesorhizobium]|uniref:hypothetical protein n=1 Tax=Mesorhizobium australicum TaxID=536018 RepID=UPI00333DC605
MAMTRQLFSISGLAVELDRDRRTIAKALERVPAEGTVSGGHQAWYLSTAMRAMKGGRGDASALDHYLDRLIDWEELTAREPVDLPIDEACKVFGITRDTMVTWLRCGMPYAVAGDFTTGEGFVLRSKWLLDWQIALTCIASAVGWPPAAKILKIPEV